MTLPAKIFSFAQIKKADEYTMQHEPIASIDLMERAAMQCVKQIKKSFSPKLKYIIFCGLGNNGGDGLAIARLLHEALYNVEVYIIRYSDNYSEDFMLNEKRLLNLKKIPVKNVSNPDDFPLLLPQDIIIDAIFGTGLKNPPEGLIASCIHQINNSNAFVISIDLPSGLYADKSTPIDAAIVRANLTLSFQFCKLAFLFAQNECFVGDWKILDIGLSEKFTAEEPTSTYYLNASFIQQLIQPRRKFSHKGNYGHGLLIAGSFGKIGAAVLAAQACIKSGIGLLTIHLPACGYEILQTTTPQAMVLADSALKNIQDIVSLTGYSAVGIGPGIGTLELTQKSVYELLKASCQPLVLDADALNILSLNKAWLQLLPSKSILTPHPKEFERLTQLTNDNFERHELQVHFSKKYQVYVILKGAHTCITTPEGNSYFNNTGNSGMAKGGSGDALTGIITALLAQGYDGLSCCLAGAYIHGLAGDMAKTAMGEISMGATDIINYLPKAFMQILNKL